MISDNHIIIIIIIIIAIIIIIVIVIEGRPGQGRPVFGRGSALGGLLGRESVGSFRESAGSFRECVGSLGNVWDLSGIRFVPPCIRLRFPGGLKKGDAQERAASCA